MEHHCEDSSCCKSVPNPSVLQNLDEMDFERGIWQAALDNDIGRLKELFHRSPNLCPNSTDSYGYTALHYASRAGHLEAAEYLLLKGADINKRTRNNGTTPLHRAVLVSKIPMIKFLIERGCRTDLQDNDGLTPLERAQKEGKKEVIEILKGAADLTK